MRSTKLVEVYKQINFNNSLVQAAYPAIMNWTLEQCLIAEDELFVLAYLLDLQRVLSLRDWIGIGFNLVDKSRWPALSYPPPGIIDILIPEINTNAAKEIQRAFQLRGRAGKQSHLKPAGLELGRRSDKWLEIFFYQGLEQCLWELTGFDTNQAPVQVGAKIVRLIKEGCTLAKLTARITAAEILLSNLLKSNLEVFNLIAATHATADEK
jgi:hypothetical protein